MCRRGRPEVDIEDCADAAGLERLGTEAQLDEDAVEDCAAGVAYCVLSAMAATERMQSPPA